MSEITPEMLALLPDDARLTFDTTVGQLRAMFARGAAESGTPAKRRITPADVAAMRGCSLTTARTLFRLIDGARKANGRDWECTREQYAAFEEGVAGGRIQLPRKNRKPSVSAAARTRPDLGAWRNEDTGAAPPKRRAAGGGR